MDCAGILCNEDHVVLSEVAEMLEDRGVRVDFLDPEVKLRASDISEYDVMVPKKSREAVYHNMRLADKLGLETLNGFLTGMSADHNLASIRHLEEKGFRVPTPLLGTEAERRDGEFAVEKPLLECYRVEPVKMNGGSSRGDDYFLEEFIPSDGTDYKLYIIDCSEPYVAGVMTDSKLSSGDGERKRFDPGRIGFGPEKADEILSTFYDADFLGVDVILNDGDPYIVDVNSAPSFRGVEEAPEKLAEAIYARI